MYSPAICFTERLCEHINIRMMLYFKVNHISLIISMQRVHLHFERFDVQEATNCANDSLVITDSDAGDVTYTLCGNNLPGDVMSSGNVLSVVFRTDSSVTKSGFVITYTARTVTNGKYC